MNQPIVSVVIPCYRQAHFLPEALDSVLAQTHPAVEIIVVNDGSPDDTEAVAARYASRITYIRQENKGLSAARNAGIESATGEYILFLDADDLLHPSCIEWLADAIAGDKNKIAVCGCILFKHDPKEQNAKLIVPKDGDLLPSILYENIAPVNSILVHNLLVRKARGFEPGLKSCEDWDLWIRLALAGVSCIAVDQIGSYYRQTPGSMSTHKQRMLVSRSEVLVRAFNEIIKCNTLLRRYGNDLANIARYTKRRMIYRNVDSDSIASIDLMMSILIDNGYYPDISGKQAILAAIIGYSRMERLANMYYKYIDHATYRHYAE